MPQQHRRALEAAESAVLNGVALTCTRSLAARLARRTTTRQRVPPSDADTGPGTDFFGAAATPDFVLNEHSALRTSWKTTAGGLSAFGGRLGRRTGADCGGDNCGDDERDDYNKDPRGDPMLQALWTGESFHVSAPIVDTTLLKP